MANISSADEILGGILNVAREHLDIADPALLELEPSALLELRLVEDLGLDSIQLLTLAVEVENHFEVTLDEFDPGGEASGEQSPADQAEALGTAAGEAAASSGGIETLGSLVALIDRETQRE